MITLSVSDFIQVLQQKIFSLQRLGSNLLHLIRVDRKYEFLKKFCFVLNKGTWSTFLVLKAKLRFGMLYYLKFPLFDVVLLNVTCCATLMLNNFMLHNFNIVLLLFDAALFNVTLLHYLMSHYFNFTLCNVALFDVALFWRYTIWCSTVKYCTELMFDYLIMYLVHLLH